MDNGIDERLALSSTQYVMAGAVSSFMSRVVVQPLDVVKIRTQLQPTASRLKQQYLHPPKAKYRNVLQSFRLIVREEGLQALWKGHVPAQLMSILYGSVQFSVYQKLKLSTVNAVFGKHSISGQQKVLPVIDFITGGLAGITATLACQPLDTLRTRFIAQQKVKVYNGVFDACLRMMREGGIKTFYKGLFPAVLSVFPLTGLQFCFYGLLCKLWIYCFQHQEVTKMRSIVCGGIAGVSSKILLLPLDVARKRFQIQGFQNLENQYMDFKPYKSLTNCLQRIVRHEGYLALFKGTEPSILKAGVLVSLTFFGYEEACKILRAYNSKGLQYNQMDE